MEFCTLTEGSSVYILSTIFKNKLGLLRQKWLHWHTGIFTVSISLDGTTVPQTLREQLVQFLRLSIIQFTFIIHIRRDDEECYHEANDAKTSPGTCWFALSHRWTQTRTLHWEGRSWNTTGNSRGIVTRVRISVRKIKGEKETSLTRGRSRKRTGFRVLRGIRKRESYGQNRNDSFNTLKMPINVERLRL